MVDSDGESVEAEMTDDGRVALLERRTERLSERVERLEAALAARGPAVPEAAAWRPRASADRPAPPPPSDAAGRGGAAGAPGAKPLGWPRVAAATAQHSTRGPLPAASQRAGLEDLVAGRVLAWAGGLAVFVGLVLLFAVAVSRGWVGEGVRTLIGGLGSFALAATGAWLQERRARTDAAMAAAAAGIAGLFATSVVAARVYEVVPVEVALLLVLATGAAATALALRWHSRGMAWLGVVGGLAAPLLVGAPAGGGTATLLFVAALAAAAICVHRAWDWLGLAAFAVVTPQWLAGLSEHPVSAAATFGTLAAFGALFAAAAVGHDLRTCADAPRPAALLLLALNAFVTAAAGWAIVGEDVGATAADVWLALVAAAHLALGVALLRPRRATRTVAIAALGLGAVVADVAIAQALNGLVLALVWTGAVAGFAALARRVRAGALEEAALATGLGAHVALALLHMLVVEAPPEAVAAGEGSAAAATAVAALAAACLTSGALLDRRPVWRDLVNALGLAALAYLAAVALDGAALVVAWSAEAAALASLARRARRREARDEAEAPDARDTRDSAAARAARPPAAARAARPPEWVAGAVVPLQLALALAGAYFLAAPWRAVLDGVSDVRAAVVSLVAVAVAAAISGEAAKEGVIADGDPDWRLVLHGASLVALAWLAIVTLDGAVLVAVLAAGAAVLAELGRRTGDDPAVAGAAAVLGLALGHAVAIEAPPQALLDGVDDLAAAAVALGACAIAAQRIAAAVPSPWTWFAPAAAALHLASVALVTTTGAGERAQMLLSALWAAVGVATLIAGLVRDVPALRSGALAVIGIALAKVFLYDLATLEAMARVASFLALGLLLLAGAFAWQRIRPRPLPDLREAPPGARG
ncbi:MAG TPA: DUF2339 domain-containing protein [Solirubrobacteraceae bacterium]|jgi:uncharacterized membrane protein